MNQATNKIRSSKIEAFGYVNPSFSNTQRIHQDNSMRRVYPFKNLQTVNRSMGDWD